MSWPKRGRIQQRQLHLEDRGRGERYARGSAESPKKLTVGSDKISSAFMRGLGGSFRSMQITSQSLYPMRECVGMNRRHPTHAMTVIDGHGTSEYNLTGAVFRTGREFDAENSHTHIERRNGSSFCSFTMSTIFCSLHKSDSTAVAVSRSKVRVPLCLITLCGRTTLHAVPPDRSVLVLRKSSTFNVQHSTYTHLSLFLLARRCV